MSEPTRQLRIAIYHNLPSGGGKRALREMVRALASRHELDVYTLSSAEHDFADLRRYVNRHAVITFEPARLFKSPLGRLNPTQRLRDLGRLSRVNQEIARTIDAADYDVAFVHNCRISQSPDILRFLTTPTVYYCQEPLRLVYEPAPRVGRRSRIRRALDAVDPFPHFYLRSLTDTDRRGALAADRVLVNSFYSRESFYRAYGRFSSVCYLGVDTDLFHPAGRQTESMVLSVGYLGPRKGFDFLVRSLGIIDEAIRPRLMIVSNAGEPGEQEFIETLARQCGVEVSFRSMVSDEELVDLYNSAIATLYAPIMEPFGFVPIESMACGTPVVGVREAGVRETVIDGQTGFLCPREEKEFAAAVVKLLTDRVCRDELGRRARANVQQQWQWSATADELEQVFRTVAGERIG